MSDTVNGYRLSSRAAEVARGRGGHDTGPAIENAVSSAAIATADPGDVFEWFGGGQQAAGMTITPETAMRSTAVWRCVTLISGALMTQELGVYRLSPKGEFIREHGHPYDRFLNCEPNQEMTSAVFVENIAIQLLLRGNGYGLIRQARNGTITSIDFYFPARVLPYRSADRSIWYRFTNEDGTTEDHHASYILLLNAKTSEKPQKTATFGPLRRAFSLSARLTWRHVKNGGKPPISATARRARDAWSDA